MCLNKYQTWYIKRKFSDSSYSFRNFLIINKLHIIIKGLIIHDFIQVVTKSILTNYNNITYSNQLLYALK